MEDYFADLTPRQQLCDLMHQYAKANGNDYPSAWKELDRRWKARPRTALSLLRWRHNQTHGTRLTLPGYLEATGQLEEALRIGHEMTGKLA